jgi:hypothetical protein
MPKAMPLPISTDKAILFFGGYKIIEVAMNCFTRGLVLCALSFLMCSGAALAADPIGKVVAVIGAPSASGPGGDRKLGANAAVFENDKVTVGSSGNAQIILNDGTKLVVGPSSSLLLDKFVMKGFAWHIPFHYGQEQEISLQYRNIQCDHWHPRHGL